MSPPLRLARWLRSSRTWIILGILAPLGMLALSALMLLELRHDAWEKAERSAGSLLQVVEGDIARNVEIIDLSLRAVVDNLKAPGLSTLSPELRQLLLFDRAVTAREMGVVLVLDETGNVVIDAGALPPRQLNNADRDYFQAHKRRSDLGLYVSRPVVSRLLGVPVVVVSRRIDKPDGSFGGIVLGSLKLSYFSRLFERVRLGPGSAINLYLRDGTRLMRHPAIEGDIGGSIVETPSYGHFRDRRSGHFRGASVRDGVDRYNAFTQVADLPLVLNVAVAIHEIEAEWRNKAVVIGLSVLILCGLTIALSVLFGGELRRSAAMQAELARLSRTDSLTGLANRRRFDEAFARASNAARRSSRPLTLLLIDADHFKRINDHHGHAVGDAVLRKLAGSLRAGAHRPEDLACRVGGEEFAILLPDTDLDGAVPVAERVHRAVSALSIPRAGIDAGSVTVSIGIASGLDGGEDTAERLYRRADAALYAAKKAGRNQTCTAPSAQQADVAPEEKLRLQTA
ncbi:sensor domain-containing diguanylate cyclase [Methylobacterium sp. Leaf118]|uniref:sensor domain-containing diguanylate cyclase n=1 Tax=Methylobacterium sp. Leaf118 TaxID=2876562 RepID=UPI001E4D4504|nr:sensor domain-containing diguanylate cyclase [Methylobacterium sp. Leaf118]